MQDRQARVLMPACIGRSPVLVLGVGVQVLAHKGAHSGAQEGLQPVEGLRDVLGQRLQGAQQATSKSARCVHVAWAPGGGAHAGLVLVRQDTGGYAKATEPCPAIAGLLAGFKARALPRLLWLDGQATPYTHAEQHGRNAPETCKVNDKMAGLLQRGLRST